MKLEHLIQSYSFNRIPAKIKEEIQEGNERAGIIEFYDGITASYLLDNEDIVVAMKIFFNCITNNQKTISNQIEHTNKVLDVMQKTIMSLDNVSQKETNMILEKLGLFNDTFKEEKQIKHLEYSYGVEVIDGLLCFSIQEIERRNQYDN